MRARGVPTPACPAPSPSRAVPLCSRTCYLARPQLLHRGGRPSTCLCTPRALLQRRPGPVGDQRQAEVVRGVGGEGLKNALQKEGGGEWVSGRHGGEGGFSGFSAWGCMHGVRGSADLQDEEAPPLSIPLLPTASLSTAHVPHAHAHSPSQCLTHTAAWKV